MQGKYLCGMACASVLPGRIRVPVFLAGACGVIHLSRPVIFSVLLCPRNRRLIRSSEACGEGEILRRWAPLCRGVVDS